MYMTFTVHVKLVYIPCFHFVIKHEMFIICTRDYIPALQPAKIYLIFTLKKDPINKVNE